MLALEEAVLVSCASNVVHQNWPSSPSKECLIFHFAAVEAQHPTDDEGHVVVSISKIIANSAPFSDIDFNPSGRSVDVSHLVNNTNVKRTIVDGPLN